MKKLLLGSLLLGSISSYSMESFNIALSQDRELLENSKNYEAKFTNDDGSITIYRPKFSDPNGSGTNLRIGENGPASLQGICKLFGFGPYIMNSALDQPGEDRPWFPSGELVLLSAEGKYAGVESYSDHDAVESVICSPISKTKVAPSKNASSITTLDDGSVSIVEPMFSTPDGHRKVHLTAKDDSGRDGICKLFGFSKHVKNSAHYDGRGTYLFVILSSEGKFKNFISGDNAYAIERLVCIK